MLDRIMKFRFSKTNVLTASVCFRIRGCVFDDIETKPPPVKKSSGRPMIKRYRPRSKYMDHSVSTVKCSTCGQNGRNRRTCGRQKRRPDELQITEEQPTQTAKGARRKRPPNEVKKWRNSKFRLCTTNVLIPIKCFRIGGCAFEDVV